MRSALTLIFALGVSVVGCLAPAIAAAGGKGKAGPPIVIERQGSFTAGGTVVGDSTKSLHCDHGYVDYQIPVHARKTSLFLWHSSSTQVWQQRWDGGDGYQTILLRRGYPVYLWDGPRVGRGNMSCESRTYNPVI